MFKGMKTSGAWWFRILGVGILALRVADHPPLFSERYGYRMWLYAFGWKVSWLPKSTESRWVWKTMRKEKPVVPESPTAIEVAEKELLAAVDKMTGNQGGWYDDCTNSSEEERG